MVTRLQVVMHSPTGFTNLEHLMLQPDTCSKNRSGILIKKKRDKLKKAAEHAKHKQKDMEAICLLPHIPSHDCVARECERVIINVSGQLFETQRSTLNRYPETLLGNEAKIKKFWDPRRKEYFLDRHRPSFQAILYYYQSGGRVRRPIEVHDDIFLEELQFYEIDEETITKYKKKEGFILEEDRVLPKKEWMKKLWLFCEEPESSGAARLFAIVTIISVFVSITDLCVGTLPNFRHDQCERFSTDGGKTYHYRSNPLDSFFLIETICTMWFLLELTLRFIACPTKSAFWNNLMNIFDILAILPFFIVILLYALDVCQNITLRNSGDYFLVARVLRVFRLFKLSKHSHALQVLGKTIQHSIPQLSMFMIFLCIGVFMFSFIIYEAERDEENRQIHSIPGAFWWAIVTMTTVGYGDVVPVGYMGKLVGTVCVLVGVLTVALPVPVIVSNFNNVYRRHQVDSSLGI